VFQDPFGSLSPRLSVGEIIAEGPKAHVDGDGDGDGYSLQQRVTDVLEEVGLEADFQDRYPHEFSGGQRQRIAIARALILRPEVIIFDEPTSALDVTVQKQIIELLLNLQQRNGLSYIFISHDISLIGTICHTMFVMKDGEIVEMGSVQKILNTPSDAYTQTLINAANRK
jgi:microcin C transport system ATP-binding protein